MTEIDCSSPACAIAEADDAYMGYAGPDELAPALGRLLHANLSSMLHGYEAGA